MKHLKFYSFLLLFLLISPLSLMFIPYNVRADNIHVVAIDASDTFTFRRYKCIYIVNTNYKLCVGSGD